MFACPHCGFSNADGRRICKECGKDLTAAPAPVIATQPADPARARALLTSEIASLSAKGWRIVSQTETSAQLAQPRQWSRVGLLLFVVAPIVIGVLFYMPLVFGALIGLLLVVADYLLKKEQMTFITAEQLAARRPVRAFAKPDGTGTFRCSACNEVVAHDAKQCPHCGTRFSV